MAKRIKNKDKPSEAVSGSEVVSIAVYDDGVKVYTKDRGAFVLKHDELFDIVKKLHFETFYPEGTLVPRLRQTTTYQHFLYDGIDGKET